MRLPLVMDVMDEEPRIVFEDNCSSIKELAVNEPLYKAAHTLSEIWQPTIIISGLIGNILILLVMMQRSYRRNSCANYIAALAVSDSVALIRKSVDVFQFLGGKEYTKRSCSGWVYVALAACQLSTLLVVCMTIDRLISVRFPNTSTTYCKPRRARIIMTVCLIVVLIFNIPHFFLTEPVANNRYCASFRNQELQWLALPYGVLQGVFNFIIPVIALVIMTSFIIITLRKNRIRHMNLRRKNPGLRDSLSNNLIINIITDGLFHYVIPYTPFKLFEKKQKNISERDRIKQDTKDLSTEETMSQARKGIVNEAFSPEENQGNDGGSTIENGLEANEKYHDQAETGIELQHQVINGTDANTDALTQDRLDEGHEAHDSEENNEKSSRPGEESDEDHGTQMTENGDQVLTGEESAVNHRSEITDFRNHVPTDEESSGEESPVRHRDEVGVFRNHFPTDEVSPVSNRNEITDFENKVITREEAPVRQGDQSTDLSNQAIPGEESPANHWGQDSDCTLTEFAKVLNELGDPEESGLSSEEGTIEGKPPFSRQESNARRKKDGQLSFLLVLVVLFFLALTSMQFVRYIIYAANLLDECQDKYAYAKYYMLYQISNKLYFTNCAINFFLYICGSSLFRLNLKEFFVTVYSKCKNTCHRDVSRESSPVWPTGSEGLNMGTQTELKESCELRTVAVQTLPVIITPLTPSVEEDLHQSIV